MGSNRQRKLQSDLGYVPALVYLSTPHGDSTITVWCVHQQEFEDLKQAAVTNKPFQGKSFAIPNDDSSKIIMVAMKRPEHVVA